MKHLFFLYSMMSFIGVATAGCDDAGGSNSARENSAKLCKDNEDNDGDGAVDCDDVECAAFKTCNPVSDAVVADISGMPIPPVDDVSAPSNGTGHLEILDWAGFEAAVTYTFDDSHPSHIEHYDALQATGVSMTFFVVNATATDTEAWSKAVEDGHELGNHTAHHCHQNLSGDCAFGDPLDSADAELGACSELITDEFGQEGVWSMAAPYGEPWWAPFGEAFVLMNRTVNSGAIPPNGNNNPLYLPSVMVSGGARVDTLNDHIDQVQADGEWLIFCFHAISPTSESSSGAVHIDAITGSIDHGKALETVWMDSMVNIGAYWLGQRILSSVTPEEEGERTVWRWALPDHFPPGKYLRVTVDGGTLSQNDKVLSWSPHGYYEVALDDGVLTLTP